MHSLNQQFDHWLLEYQHTEIFGCTTRTKSCACYHLISPVLHHIGLLKSYSAYSVVLFKMLNEFFLTIDQPDILVVGIDSEVSANSLIQVLDFFDKKYNLTFIDCCPTPLNRIRACLELHESSYISTSLIDIFNPHTKSFYNKFDLVFADSFLKQLAPAKKKEALSIISNFSKNDNSRFVIREHYGDINQLLASHWANLDYFLKKKGLYLSDSASILKRIHFLVGKLDQLYKNQGSLYKDPAVFKADIAYAGLEIVQEFLDKEGINCIVLAKLNQQMP